MSYAEGLGPLAIISIAALCEFVLGFCMGKEWGYTQRHREAVDDWMRWHMDMRAEDHKKLSQPAGGQP